MTEFRHEEDQNRAVYRTGLVDSIPSHDTSLLPGEASFLASFGPDRLSAARVLDLGVGAGRSAPFFGEPAKSYVGVDYSEPLVRECRTRFRESKHLRFEVGDARSLHELDLGEFDLVVFSYNGLDYSDHADRLLILAEVRRLLSRDGIFFFSSHSIHGAARAWYLPSMSLRSPLRSIMGFAKSVARFPVLVWKNRRVNLSEGRRRGYAILNDGAHRFRFLTYYVDPAEQCRQLRDAGFGVVDVLDHNGESVDCETVDRGWVSYVGRPVPDSA